MWPTWLESHAATAGAADRERLTAPGPARLVGGVCEDCVGGWIDQLNNAAQPLVSAMLASETVSLREDDQRILGAWALLEAILLALAGPSTPIFPASHVEELYRSAATQPSAPQGVSIDLFRYGGAQWSAFHRAYSLTLTFGGVVGPPDTPAYGITFTVGHVGFQLFGISVADLHIDRRAGKLGRRLVRQIWPFRRNVVWPISPALDDEQLIALADSFAGEPPAPGDAGATPATP